MNMKVTELSGTRVPVKMWTREEAVEPQALDQLRRVAALPWVFHHVAVMPDVHYGIGCTVGSVIAMKDAIAPAAVGVDIGCGMAAVRTSLTAADLPDSLDAIRFDVEVAIPTDFSVHSDTRHADGLALWDEFAGLTGAVQDQRTRAMQSLGTLGGGNHFIELRLGAADRVWLMLHSGSRGIGNKLASFHIERARKLAHNADLPDRDLAVFLAGTPEMAEYRRDLFWAQRYAMENRALMLSLFKSVLWQHFPEVRFDDPISCQHNYVAEEIHFGEEVMVTRKGAIRARAGDMGIIPGSMGARSYIVRGLGNPESFCSASHGAGRLMSRGEARRRFTQADLEAQTAGVCCRKDDGVLDEIPGAYKPIEEVMANQSDLVEIVEELRQVMCVKGAKKRGEER